MLIQSIFLCKNALMYSSFFSIKTFSWGEFRISHNEEFVMVGEEIEPAVFQLCGETPEDLREAKNMINSLILRSM